MSIDTQAIDRIQPGDVVTLTRTWQPGAHGFGSPARRFVATLTVRSLDRSDDEAGRPRWWLTGVEPETAGGWVIGDLPSVGMVTTLAAA